MTEICPPCRDAADLDVILAAEPGSTPIGHNPTLCRDHAIQPGGCPCQHRPVTRPAPTAEGETR